MSEPDVNKITVAATAVMTALEPLNSEERARVLQSTAALYGLGLGVGLVEAALRDENPHISENRDGHKDTSKKLSIVEFLREKQPATNSQRIAAFAYYRENVEKKERFSRTDLEPYFATAKLQKPANYDRDFTGAVREGWIHEDGGNSYLTQGGEDAVRDGFGGKAKPRGTSVTRRKRPRAAKVDQG